MYVSTALHVLAACLNVVGWWVVFNYMQTPLTLYFLESSGQAAYMETDLYPYDMYTLEQVGLGVGYGLSILTHP